MSDKRITLVEKSTGQYLPYFQGFGNAIRKFRSPKPRPLQECLDLLNSEPEFASVPKYIKDIDGDEKPLSE